ncbi:hypothetical protein [Microbacterium hydrocarbonoxydans]|uniref:hypothetical protein n=1 Tax=Microbacterium hydrocarbonoxydans TaxID=273678 RepID=UPI0007679CE2|nr:hypothetical protein [Microbacterium hydrocarbonoxydans]
MPEYLDADDRPISEEEALVLPDGHVFKLVWEDGRSVECTAVRRGELWRVSKRHNGAHVPLGRVEKVDHLYLPVSVSYMKAQETFSAAARKYLE